MLKLRRGVVPPPVGHHRFLVPIAQLPKQLQNTSHGRTSWSCLQDTASKRTSIEVVRGEPRPFVHYMIDQGSIGFCAKQFPSAQRGPHQLRGWLEADPAHRRHNNMLVALGRVDVLWASDEVLRAQSWTSAPFSTKAHFGTLVGVAEVLFSNLHSSSDFFSYCYGPICHQVYHGHLPSDFGSADHRRFMWDF